MARPGLTCQRRRLFGARGDGRLMLIVQTSPAVEVLMSSAGTLCQPGLFFSPEHHIVAYHC